MSPNGKFGFHVTTYDGNQPSDNNWCDTWEAFFVRAMRQVVRNEIAVQGENDVLSELMEKLCTKVIPRLLRPLEIGGRKIRPRLVHGDLWHGNVGVDVVTNGPILFDSCALYAHKECWSKIR